MNIRVLDMLFAFFLFWPANIIPIWLLAIMLQFFIPLNMTLRTLCCIYQKPKRVHVISMIVIYAAVIIGLLGYILHLRN